MKYTVVIQQPVQDEVRAELERQLSQRLGLSASAAAKLAGRRSGRLLKPTTRPKAERLLGIFGAVGAAVSLEEVPEEGELSGLTSAPLGGAGPEPAASAVPGSALAGAGAPGALSPAGPPQGDHAAGAAADPFGLGTLGADPFGVGPFGADPFGADPFGADPFAAPQSEGLSQVFSAVPGTVGTAGSVGLAAGAPAAEAPASSKAEPAADEWASFTQDLSAAGTKAESTGAGGEDVWADFADALKVDVPVQPNAEPSPAPLAPSFMDMSGEEALPAVRGPRRSLERQLLLTALLPTAALSLLSLLLLSLLLPASERGRTAAQAQTLAHSLSTTLSTADPAGVQDQLRTLAGDDEIAFVQVRLPNGPTYFASDAAEGQSQAMQQAFAEWQKAGGKGEFRNGGAYVVGQTDAPEATAQAIQVAVGVPHHSNLTGVLLPWLLASLALLGLAALWARRAARALLDPVQRLVRAADAISAGDLSQPVQAEANDEVGDLAQALERMRLSLSAAMDRLRRRKR